ncbi:ejaculatory bulb-specific protein 3 [Folsomia candida]|uniref:Ejaculatory bulb-specific protein 3 n=1 Tax=Folsomia candida TaxID=158441 RepID=A0A226EZL6_FOLCA|nr:ejaculatory bulb-specific protein 3 [Folsomia candida]OXA62116.1 Ejaculatory bulb-specific protein 3 [Folsomia candida]
MSKEILLLVIGVVIGVGMMTCANGQVVTSEILERINVDTYLQNRRLVEYHVSCLVYNGPCDKIGNEIKRLFNSFRYSGISTTECRVCSEEQKRRLSKIAQHWQSHYPQAWRDLNTAMRNR